MKINLEEGLKQSMGTLQLADTALIQIGFTLAPPQLTWTLAMRALAMRALGLLAALPPAIGAVRVSPLRHL